MFLADHLSATARWRLRWRPSPSSPGKPGAPRRLLDTYRRRLAHVRLKDACGRVRLDSVVICTGARFSLECLMDAQPIHLFSPHYRVEGCVDEVRECLTEGWTGWGAKCIEMEQAWRDYSGFRYAHFLNSATAGLHLAMKIFKKADGWRDGDEVITTPLTFPSTNHAVLYENLKPVFADVDEFLCLDPKSVLERISPRTRAVAFVGLGGNTGRYQEVRRICGDHGLRLIVDAAHMAGTREGGRHAGLDADASVFSFHAVKNLPTADSGMVCFQDEKFDLEARRWSWLGIDKDTYARTREDGSYSWIYEVDRTGYKYQGNSIMAALGLVGVRYLEVDNETRRQIALW
jgi:dTDP-4-amino-4,6-dideoxygalactose transaminase